VTDGGTLSYQWYINRLQNENNDPVKGATDYEAIDPWTLIEGATGASFFPDTSKTGRSQYRVVVTNTKDEKTASVTSNEVEVMVERLIIATRYTQDLTAAAPIIEVQPQDLHVRLGRDAVSPLTVSAMASDGGTLSYQWYIYIQPPESQCAKGDPGCYETQPVTWTPIDGATEASFFPDTSKTGWSQYHVVVTNTKDGKTASVTSNTAIVWMEPKLPLPASVQTQDRLIPQTKTTTEAAVAPITATVSGFTAGPNPVSRGGGAVVFFHQGKRLKEVALSVYDASGAFVKKTALRDNAANGQSSRPVGSWDLTDSKGRPVQSGTYLVKGAIKTADGKSENVSLVIGVR
jgi:hypothetical protein